MRVVASEGTEPLVGDLARVLMDAPADPMTPEWIAVGSEGLQRWLQLQLAQHLGAQSGRTDGVAANIVFKYPGSLRTSVLLSGSTNPEFDPWHGNRLVWAVLETLKTHGSSDPLLSPLTGGSSRSTYRRAKVIAARFGDYQLHRPEMVRAWFDHNDLDGAGRAIVESQRWQPHLWRLIRKDLDIPSPAERLTHALDAVRSGSADLSLDGRPLPPRLIFFGPSLLPSGAGFLEVAEAVAASREVIVYVIEPSAALSIAMRNTQRPEVTKGPADRDVYAHLAVHPLLRSWGRLQRETALLLSRSSSKTAESATGVETREFDVISISNLEPATLLQQVQADIRGNNAPAGAFNLTDSDRSLTLHRCYGPTRQVEVLRDLLLTLLNDQTLDLTEDDIIVASPALETFAPLIRAVFGPSATERESMLRDGTPLLRYRVTGLAGSASNPATTALLSALQLATSRFDATEILEFLNSPSLCWRFGWSEQDVARIGELVEDTNIKWGLSGEHRTKFDLTTELESFTWRTALDQLLMGTIIQPDDRSAFGDVLAVENGFANSKLVGELASIIETLSALSDLAATDRPVGEWVDILQSVMDALFAPDPEADWQLDDTRRLLGRIVDSTRLTNSESTGEESAIPEASTVPITFRELTQIISDMVDERHGRSDFFRGGITITTLNALRNIPAKAICLLGADQGAFSVSGVASDDLIAINPRVGDRDRRAEVRQSLLDALLSATDRFSILADGHDVRTNTDIPDAVVVAELLDTIDLTATTSDLATKPSELITFDHPRQPFDETYFTPIPRSTESTGEDADSKALHLLSFSRSGLEGALSRRERGLDSNQIDWPRVRLSHPVTGEVDLVELSTLKSVLKDAAKVFVREGLGVRLPTDDDSIKPDLPLDLDSLDKWSKGTELLDVLEKGESVSAWTKRAQILGDLPPLGLGEHITDELVSDAQEILRVATEAGVATRNNEVVNIELDLPNGCRINGRVPLGLGKTTGTATISFSYEKKADLLNSWIDLLALTAMNDSQQWRAAIINRPKTERGKRKPVPVRRLAVRDITANDALEALSMISTVYSTATRTPVPFFPDLSWKLYEDSATYSDWNKLLDGYSEAIKFLYGETTYGELLAGSPEGHPLLDGKGGAAEQYADLIWGRFEATISIVDEDPADD